MNNRPLWSRFSADPRTHGQMRASDADRAVVTDVLSEAYALGQIDAEEFDERTEAAGRLKVLSEVPGLVEDLVISESDDLEPGEMNDAARAQALARLESDRIPITPEQIEVAAQKYYKDRVRQSLLGLIAGPAGVTIGIWAFSSIVNSHFIFFWPIFVIVPMLLGAISRISHKDEIIRNRRRELTQRARAHLGDSSAKRQVEQSDRDGEVDTDGYGHGLQPPHPLEPPYSPDGHSSPRDEIRRRRGERRRRRGNPWD